MILNVDINLWKQGRCYWLLCIQKGAHLLTVLSWVVYRRNYIKSEGRQKTTKVIIYIFTKWPEQSYVFQDILKARNCININLFQCYHALCPLLLFQCYHALWPLLVLYHISRLSDSGSRRQSLNLIWVSLGLPILKYDHVIYIWLSWLVQQLNTSSYSADRLSR